MPFTPISVRISASLDLIEDYDQLKLIMSLTTLKEFFSKLCYSSNDQELLQNLDTKLNNQIASNNFERTVHGM